MRTRAGSGQTAACRARRDERGTGAEGTSALEFALVLPVLLALVFGLVEFGNIFFISAAMDKAAQVGARKAVTGEGEDNGARLALVRQAARDVAEPAAGSNPVTVLVRSWPTTSASGSATENDAGSPCGVVEVEVRCDYSPITPIVGDMLPDPFTLMGRGRMVNEPWMPCG